VNADDYLRDLKDFEQQQGISRLRTLAAEFFSTLDRLPKLKQEVEAMQQMQGVNLDDLATSLEQHLDKAANLLARLDLLPDEIRNAQELEGLIHGLQNVMTLRTIDTWVLEFDVKCNEAKTSIAKYNEYLLSREERKVKISVAKKSLNTPKDGLYTDSKTGLIWPMNTNIHGKKMRWDDAMKWVKKFRYAGYSDWRLPSKDELEFMVNQWGELPMTLFKEIGFINFIPGIFWSSSTALLDPNRAVAVSLTDGTVYNSHIAYPCYVWPVRS
jgi:hypothetical protein